MAPNLGGAGRGSLWKRAALGLPFVGLFFFAKSLMSLQPLMPIITEVLTTGKLPWGDAPLPMTFYRVNWLDQLITPFVVFFAPVVEGYPSVTPQALALLVDFGVVIAVWSIESVRRGSGVVVRYPLLFTLLGQVFGIGVISPLYYLCHYTTSRLGDRPGTARSTAYLKTLFPALALAYYVPMFLSVLAPSFDVRIAAQYAWQPSPLWFSLLGGQVLARCVRDAPETDVAGGLSVTRGTVGAAAALSALTWWYAWAKAGFAAHGLWGIVREPIQPGRYAAGGEDGLVVFVGDFLRMDSAFLFANSLLWLGYLFWDVKHAGMLGTGWGWILGMGMLSVVVLGPGATLGLGWLWREEVLVAASAEKEGKGQRKVE